MQEKIQVLIFTNELAVFRFRVSVSVSVLVGFKVSVSVSETKNPKSLGLGFERQIFSLGYYSGNEPYMSSWGNSWEPL